MTENWAILAFLHRLDHALAENAKMAQFKRKNPVGPFWHIHIRDIFLSQPFLAILATPRITMLKYENILYHIKKYPQVIILEKGPRTLQFLK